MHIPSIENFGITVLPLDPGIYPADVVATATEVERLDLAWQELEPELSKPAQEKKMHDAELLDAAAFKAAILAGQDLDDYPTTNTDRAKADMQRTATRATATVQALNETYAKLRDLLIEHVEEIRTALATQYAAASDNYRKTLDTIERTYAKASQAYADTAGFPEFIAALTTHRKAELAPAWVNTPGLDLAGAREFLDRRDRAAAAANGTAMPAFIGQTTTPAGVALRVNVLTDTIHFDQSDNILFGEVVMDDGAVVRTRRDVETVQGAWRNAPATMRFV